MRVSDLFVFKSKKIYSWWCYEKEHELLLLNVFLTWVYLLLTLTRVSVIFWYIYKYSTKFLYSWKGKQVNIHSLIDYINNISAFWLTACNLTIHDKWIVPKCIIHKMKKYILWKVT